MTITHKKAALILQHWNLDSAPITDIYYEGTGNKNENACYVGEDFVLKYTANLGKLKKNIAVSKALHNVGLLSAVPVPTVDGAEYLQDGEIYFYLTRRLPGAQMASHRFGAGDGRFVGEIIGQLHLALQQIEDCVSEADLLATVRDWALPRAKSALGLSQAFCADYLDTFAALYPALPRQIIHRDPNPGNIICSEGQWGFIDFELAERNARIYDPCYAATAILSESFATATALQLSKWIEIYKNIIYGYDSVVGLSEDEKAAIPYVILSNQFICVSWFAKQDKYQDIYRVNAEMTKWIVNNLEELKI